MIELHCHTTFSDGTLTPTELVDEAIASGVKALAITDHDTLSGWSEAFEAADGKDLEIVPGLELSTVWGNRSLHILGFYPDPEKLEGPLGDRLQGRKRRAQAMLDKLAEMGCPVTLPEQGEGMAPGRPHIAKALVAAGHAKDYEDAFNRFLSDGKPAFVQYEKFSAIEGIQLLRSCGAVPVWAHPFLFQGGETARVFDALMDAGLMGLEVYHPTHKPGQSAILKDWCNQYGLVKTGGSDYHGPSTGEKHAPHLNGFHLPMEMLEALKEAASTLKSSN